MEIGSAYALQVCLLQIPAMVAFSAWHAPEKMGSVAETFRYDGFFLTPSAVLQCLTRSLKFDLASMGRYRHYPLRVPHDLHLHRSQEQLPPWKHSHTQVRGSGLICESSLTLLPRPVTWYSPPDSTGHQTMNRKIHLI